MQCLIKIKKDKIYAQRKEKPPLPSVEEVKKIEEAKKDKLNESLDSDVAFLMSVFSQVIKGNRAIDNQKRYDDYIRQKKLKFIQFHLINK